MKDDVGHAPCVFDSLENLLKVRKDNFRAVSSNVLTLSNCGYMMRSWAVEEDYILGIAGDDFGVLADRLVWIGKVASIMPKDGYFQRFNRDSSYGLSSRPDNYYQRAGDLWIQHENPFHDADSLSADTGINKVLFFGDFFYFGNNALEMPEKLRCRDRQKLLDTPDVEEFLKHLKERFPAGVNGYPAQIKTIRRRLYFWKKRFDKKNT